MPEFNPTPIERQILFDETNVPTYVPPYNSPNRFQGIGPVDDEFESEGSYGAYSGIAFSGSAFPADHWPDGASVNMPGQVKVFNTTGDTDVTDGDSFIVLPHRPGEPAYALVAGSTTILSALVTLTAPPLTGAHMREIEAVPSAWDGTVASPPPATIYLKPYIWGPSNIPLQYCEPQPWSDAASDGPETRVVGYFVDSDGSNRVVWPAMFVASYYWDATAGSWKKGTLGSIDPNNRKRFYWRYGAKPA